jgi:hypothetical protein
MNLLQCTLCWLLVAVWCNGANSTASCLLDDAELMKQRRIQTLKNSILAQLGVSDPSPEADGDPLPGEEEMKETFNALRSASASLEREKEQRCHSDDFFAKPVSSFVGVISEGILINILALGVVSTRCDALDARTAPLCQHIIPNEQCFV